MKERKNLDVRVFIVGNGLSYKEVAKEIPISSSGLSGMLQRELPQGIKDEIIQAAKRAMLKKEKWELFEDEKESLSADRKETLLPD